MIISPRALFVFLSFFVAAISIMASLFFGGSTIAMRDIVQSILHPSLPDTITTIVWSIRIPRVVLACSVGAGLAVTGCVFQAMLCNPLAEPYTLGVSGGASLGVCCAALLGAGIVSSIPAACIGACVAMLVVYVLAAHRKFSATHLLLSGIMVNVVSSSMIVFLFSIADAPQVVSTMRWLMGSIDTSHSILLPTVGVTVCIAAVFVLAPFLDIIALGNERAMQLGVNSKRTMQILFILASLTTGLCVAYAGVIGFVGIMIPHFVRACSVHRHRALIMYSAVYGGAYLVCADALARTIVYPVELPVGVISGIMGGICFIVLLLRNKTIIVI